AKRRTRTRAKAKLSLGAREANLQRGRAPARRPRNGRAPQLSCPLPLALVLVRFTRHAIPGKRYLARSSDDPSTKGVPDHADVLKSTYGRQLGVTRYASKTASMFLSAVNRPRSSLTSPTSATYQFRAIWSSTLPP